MATCKDCIHYDVCIRIRYPSMYGLTGEDCEEFKDKSRFIQLPCKPEQPLYCLTYTKRDYVIMQPNHRLSDMVQWMEEGRFGAELFLTREEAEAEIERRKHEHH